MSLRLPAPGVDARLRDLATPEPKRFWSGILFGSLSAACAIGLMWASSYLIAASSLRPLILTLMWVIVSVRFFALGRAFFRYIERLASHDAAFRMLGRLRVGIFERLVPGAPASLSRISRGDMMSRFVSDVDDLQDLPLRFWQPLFTSVLVSAATVVVLGSFSVHVAVIVAICLVAAFVLGGVLPQRTHRRITSGAAGLRAEQNQHTLETLTGLDVLSAYEATEVAQAEAGILADRTAEVDASRASSQGITDFVLLALTGVAVIGALWAGGTELIAGAFAGTMLAVLVLVPISIFDVFGQVPAAMSALENVQVASRRIGEVIDSGVGAPDAPHAAADGALPDADAVGFTSLQLRDVSIGWSAAEPVASHINLTLHPGDRVLVTGASGAGKSTLAATLVRFLDHHAGSYLLDGIDVRDLGGDRARRTVGLCEQRPHLFASTIRANLLLAHPTAEDDELVAALQRVGLGELLTEREGLDTLVGEHGELLSGGQVQRIALARALLARFPVVVFDEPTANVDPEMSQRLLTDLLSAASDADHAPAIIVMSHDHVPAELIDRAWQLRDGTLQPR